MRFILWIHIVNCKSRCQVPKEWPFIYNLLPMELSCPEQQIPSPRSNPIISTWHISLLHHYPMVSEQRHSARCQLVLIALCSSAGPLQRIYIYRYMSLLHPASVPLFTLTRSGPHLPPFLCNGAVPPLCHRSNLFISTMEPFLY